MPKEARAAAGEGGGGVSIRIITGDCRTELAKLPDQSVHCCVTSPPYFGLRDYGHAGQIGLESTPAAFVAEMVAVFREVKRALRDDGTLWLNLGDSYCSIGHKKSGSGYGTTGLAGGKAQEHTPLRRENNGPGMKHKDLMGIPWMVAFALRSDGWYLRQDIIWSKPNPMPESIQDRCTKSHEYIFLLSKSKQYHYDRAAIAEPFADASIERLRQDIANQRGSDRVPGKTNGSMKAVGLNANRASYRPGSASNMNDGEHIKKSDAGLPLNEAGRNKRSVWEVATQPFPLAHFATFPPELIEPCIKAGCPSGGMVLDPFGGAGTTGLVADRLQRHATLIELNPEYAALARRRIDGDAPLFAGAAE